MMALITIVAVGIMVTWIGFGVRRTIQTQARIERLRNADRRNTPRTYPSTKL